MPRAVTERPMVRRVASTRARDSKASNSVRRIARAPRAAIAAPRRQASARYTYSNPGPVGRLGRIAGRLAGAYLGGPAGAVLGEAVGGMAHYIGRAAGSGDYITNSDRVKSNVLVNSAQVPQFGSSPNTVHIRHREFLGDIISSGTANTFQVQSFAINPGQFASFPWLSQVVGANFQQYRINGMLFEYRTMSADALNSVNTALGSVVMATDYDSADSAFTTKAQMENTEFGISCKPSCSMIHAIECARNQTAISELYVRPGTVPANADIRLYDLGKFYIASTGVQGTSVNLGELWVSYDITFFKAIQLVPGVGLLQAHYRLDPAQVATLPFAVLAGAPVFDTIGLTFPAGGLSFTFPLSIPVGSQWLVIAQWQSGSNQTNSTAVATSFGLANGLVNSNFWQGDTAHGFYVPNQSATNATNLRQVCTLGTFQYQGGATPAALPTVSVAAPGTPLSAYSGADLMVIMLNGNFS